MPLLNSADHYGNDRFRGRVRAAIVSKAVDVIQSTPRQGHATGDDAANVNASRRLADAVIRDPNFALETFAAVVANQAAFATALDHTTVADTVIVNTVNGGWQQVADTVG